MENGIVFYQLFEKETSSFTYILGDKNSREAIIIDPVVEMVERDLKLLYELGLNLEYILDTHIHADHITGSGELRKKTNAKTAIGKTYGVSCADIQLDDGQELSFGSQTLKAIGTPGHTAGCMSYKVGNYLFSGDALLIRGCGRTDFQDGSSETLFQSVREKLFDFPDDTVVFPAHDYKGFNKTTIGLEKSFNARLNLTIGKAEFEKIMSDLNLANPKKIHEAVPANLQCGMRNKENVVNKGTKEGVPVITVEELHSKLGHVKIFDIRGLNEFNNELGHIPEAELATLGEKLENMIKDIDVDEEIVFVCGSGNRSAKAAEFAIDKGHANSFSLDGGMMRWNQLNLPVERDMGGS